MQSPFEISIPNTHEFDLSHGFLPNKDPLKSLPPQFAAWEKIASQLPKLFASSHIRQIIEALPEFTTSQLSTGAEFERAMLVLSYLGHAYVWCQDNEIPNTIPAKLAVPWHQVAKQLGRPPVLSYASYALYNWQRLDKNKPIQLDNIALLQNFLGGIDEEWFILIHVDIEAKAIPALNALLPAQRAVVQLESDALNSNLQQIISALTHICETLKRMPEHCDPYIYYNRVRPYIHGWSGNPALAHGLIYEGVDSYHNRPQQFKGETGAQSSIIPAIDRILKISHKDNPLKTHLNEMQHYMPPSHRQFLELLSNGSSIRDYVKLHQKKMPTLKKLYNECIQLVGEFRSIHLRYAAEYIQKQNQTSLANPTSVGTGGTPFMAYLRKHKSETRKHLI